MLVLLTPVKESKERSLVRETYPVLVALPLIRKESLVFDVSGKAIVWTALCPDEVVLISTMLPVVFDADAPATKRAKFP